mgnify:CR=1 FL=1
MQDYRGEPGNGTDPTRAKRGGEESKKTHLPFSRRGYFLSRQEERMRIDKITKRNHSWQASMASASGQRGRIVNGKEEAPTKGCNI